MHGHGGSGMITSLLRSALVALLILAVGQGASAQSRGRSKSKAATAPAAKASGLAAEWGAQGREDRVGSGLAVGPDGIADSKIVLRGIRSESPIVGVVVKGAGNEWHSGANPDAKTSGELVRRADPAVGDFFLQPDRDIKGQTLSIEIHYSDARVDRARVVAGKVDPKQATPRTKLASLPVIKIGSRWVGQDGTDKVGPGDVHVALSGLPPASIAAAALSGSSGGIWVAKIHPNAPMDAGPYAMPLSLVQDPSRGGADLHFPPFRDESGGSMTLRLLFEDGRTALATIPGGKCDPGLRAGGAPLQSRIEAKPGDDLHSLVKSHGIVRLAPGRYMLSKPLVLEKPVAIEGAGATLVFSQGASDAPWSAAIKFHSGHTRLEGFAIRFENSIRWAPGLQGGPAVIGASDNTDPNPGGLKADVTFRNLDIESPAPSSQWEEAAKVLRLGHSVCGVIEGNTIKGGSIEFEGGPWRVVGNRFMGTPTGTFTFDAIAAHGTHDMVVKDNVAQPPRNDRSKVWRFLVITQHGANDVIKGNKVSNVGPRDDDKVRAENAPEIMLTESYNLHFEGRLAAVSPDGRLASVATIQGDPPRAGDALAILSGPKAGQWRTIVQPLGPTTYLLDQPLPAGAADAAVSIATGFVRETFRGNTIDARGSGGAGCLVLFGNHFGLTVTDNHFLGGNGSFYIKAAPSENPMHWGWSHAPIIGATIERNILEDSLRGGMIGVERSVLRSRRQRAGCTRR